MLTEKLLRAEDHFREIERQMTLPEIASNGKEYSKLIKEYKGLEPVVEKFREYSAARAQMEEADSMMRDSSLDSEFRELAEEEFKLHRQNCEALTEELKILLMPRDPNDDRNVIVEIRQGAGGEEAALFGYDLYRMYSMYAASEGFKIEVVTLNETETQKG